MSNAAVTVHEMGERRVVHEIVRSLEPSSILIDGFGHDSAFVDMSIGEDELLVMNTDRSGINIAYKLGLSDGRCVGDLAVSHAVSDIVASGGTPRAVSVALLLPQDTRVDFVVEAMLGAEEAAKKYGAVIACGDTKQNPKFAMVVTAIGTIPRSNRLTRSGARAGDLLCVTGHLGGMLLGTIAHRKKIALDPQIMELLNDALIRQNPPFALGRALADAGVASACTDISDGLPGAIHSMCSASSVGATIVESSVPVRHEFSQLAAELGFGRLALSLAGGDWQYLYAIPPSDIDRAMRTSTEVGAPLTVIGEFTTDPSRIVARTENGLLRRLLRVEHDSFADSDTAKGYFELISNPVSCLGEIVAN